ncbi:anaphase-promoting complex subunit 1 isoform X2 isoform B [Micractinium conductrix]|uniref:Anaphase-promoting complex subunit 1 isoform X2 isoform B n=1 Tax=Micractinium conductrix TaxID=554055 RepID=A0A2P6V5R1_9CHLO|nr:anaphase-promoting complex subunit 1 isoform X2 isoform B [Micractinium conductrix]|eukprot:PSC69420.1 anaphase-promoting complex subunit 1 isoform X2 isoform B [Micractinium conductrix]
MRRASLRLPNGCLSPAAFHPVPRSGVTPALASAAGAAPGSLLLPSQERPITFSLLWEQQIDAGSGGPGLEGHLATDANGDLLLCLLSRSTQRLTALRLPPPAAAAAAPLAAGWRVDVAFSLPATAVAAVSATLRPGSSGGGGGFAERHDGGGSGGGPPARDLLLLQPDGRLALYAGKRRLCSVALPGQAAPVAAYAQLMGAAPLGGGAVPDRGASAADEHALPGSHSQLSGSRAPAVGPSGESDDGELMLTSPAQHKAAGRAADFLPGIGSLAEALEAPPAGVTNLQHAVGNRVTLRLAGGGEARVALRFAPTGPLARAGLDALHAALPEDAWWALYARWLATEGSTSGDADEQWQALAAVVLAWAADPAALCQPQGAAPRPLPRISGASSGTTTTTATAAPQQHSASTPPLQAGPAAWQQLLRSDHHLRHASRFAWAQQAPARAAEPAPAAAAASGRDEVWRALQALHSVYEDCKMNVLRWQLLPALGRVLLRLARLLGAAGYADHYCRDLALPAEPAAAQPSAEGAPAQAEAVQASAAAAAVATAAPPDMFRALQQLLQGRRDGGGAAPPLAQQRAACVQRSADLLAAYALLADAATSLCAGPAMTEPAQAADLLEAASHRIVRLLVRQRWTLTDLESLPFGVALPLRQAIQYCRTSPPTDWPQEAYVLIGRNDIAASMAAAEQEERPAEAAVTSIVSTPLGKMAKTSSPTKKPPPGRAPPGVGTPGGATPAALRRLSAAGAAGTPPLASATRRPQQLGGAGGGAACLLTAPEGDTSSRVLASPELLPLPYTQRLQLPTAAPGGGDGGDGEGGEGAVAGAAAAGGAAAAAGDPSTGDGMDNLQQQAASLRFGRDLRLPEVRRLLRSSAPTPLRLAGVPEPSDTEGTAAQQLKLTVLAIRSCALPLGRGALTLGTLRPLPTEPLHIPPLCLAGRLPEQNNAVVNLDLSAAQAAVGGGALAEQTAWPEFHNGVAAGLRLAPGAHQLTRTWVVYNKPPEPSYTHAGMLMALGLTGHLSCLAATDLYRYLSQEHDATIIGLLLGMAASKRGTQDATISKTLLLHLPTRHPSSYPELDISPLVQAASLAGVGLLFQGSCHRVMAEVMLEEIGRRPGAAAQGEDGGQPHGAGLHKGVTQDREGYALAAGLALGLITLGRGRAAVGLADLHLEEKLRYFMVGGAPSGTVATHQGLAAAGGQAAAPGDGVFGPGVIGFDPTLGEPELRHGPLRRTGGTSRAVGSVAEELAAAQGSSQTVLEGELLNLGVTSPAAALALGLMYLQTNDAAVAAAFQLPDTHFALDFVQPEQLTLRTLMRSLVMWDSVQPTKEWLQAQLPLLLRGPLSRFMAGQGGGVLHADYEALAQAHTSVVAGACLAVGIRFAGSANAQAEALLRRYALYFLSAKQRAPEPGTGQPAYINKQQLEEALGNVALALAVVMAGSGHLPTLKLLRGLRKRVAPATASNAAQPSPAAPPTSSLTYGAHCAVKWGSTQGMALGFLFMGAGTLTFGTSPEAVAALVISLFPRMPASTLDHRCHLQAFRHLYVLAAQPRSVDAIDVDAKQAVYVPLQVTLTQPAGQHTPTAGAMLASALRPVASLSKGAGDVLSELAAERAAAAAAAEGREALPYDAAGDFSPTYAGRGGGVSFERVAPCLLPEKEQVAAVRVTGPRYWHQQLLAQRGSGRSGGRGPSLSALYSTRTLFVQRKAGALPYADDPTGVRSLLSRMAHHHGGASSDGGGAGAGAAVEGSFDLVHLCATFGSDPSIMSFAQLFCGGEGDGGGVRSRMPAAATTLADFCRGALYECITGEKPTALPAYLLLFCIKQALAPGGGGAGALAQLWGSLPPAVPLWSLALCLAWEDSALGLSAAAVRDAALRLGAGGEATAERWQPLLPPALVQACWHALEEAWERGGTASGEALRRYVASGTLGPAADAGGGTASGASAGAGCPASVAAAAGMLGAYLQLHSVPPAGALRAAAAQVDEMLQGARLGDAGSARAAAAAMLAATQRGMALPAAQALAAALLH